jgi:orotidine-5'-phosphate decarboxylase
MSDHFADRLLDAISRKGSPICVGIDPIYDMLPDAVIGGATRRDPNDLDGCIDAIFAFTTKVLEIVAPLVPCVKFQSAYFEKYVWEGVEAYYELIHEAREMGLVVVGDVKRGDIGSTSDAYAAAHLADTTFSELTGRHGDARCHHRQPHAWTGHAWAVHRCGARAPQGPVRARSHEQPRLDCNAGCEASRRTDVERDARRLAAAAGRSDAIVSASRSILYAHRDTKYASIASLGWEKCVEQAVHDMRADLTQIVE